MSALSRKTQGYHPKKKLPILETILLILGVATAILISALDTPNGMTQEEVERAQTSTWSQK